MGVDIYTEKALAVNRRLAGLDLPIVCGMQKLNGLDAFLFLEHVNPNIGSIHNMGELSVQAIVARAIEMDEPAWVCLADVCRPDIFDLDVYIDKETPCTVTTVGKNTVSVCITSTTEMESIPMNRLWIKQ